jgi:glycine dehydrogenase
MISLGSCTMKLNATSEMIPVTWPEFADIHPFAPADQTAGYLEMIEGLTDGCARSPASTPSACSPTPAPRANTPACWRSPLPRSRGDHRNVCLIPKSAHGTNPATAQMAAWRWWSHRRQRQRRSGDLKAKAEQHADKLPR